MTTEFSKSHAPSTFTHKRIKTRLQTPGVMRYAVYARQSTKEQPSVPVQIERLKKWPRTLYRGQIELVAEISGVQRGDEDSSPLVQQAIKLIRNGCVDIVLAETSDRITRNARDLSYFSMSRSTQARGF